MSARLCQSVVAARLIVLRIIDAGLIERRRSHSDRLCIVHAASPARERAQVRFPARPLGLSPQIPAFRKRIFRSGNRVR
jgi:hypothetical protein